jgi:FkbM family methyltransferase
MHDTAPRVLPTTPQLLEETLGQLARRQIHDADFELLGTFIRPGTDVLDIGANRGQSMVSLHLIGHQARLHSFEANPLLFPVLQSIAERCDAKLHRYGLGDAHERGTLYVPWAKGMCYLAVASINPEYFQTPWVVEKFVQRGGLELESIEIEIRPGDELALAPSLIKVDVEGAELRVLKGLRETIERHRPVILAENSDFQNVTAFLGTFGYAPYMNDGGTLVPLTRDCTNTFYLPQTPAGTPAGYDEAGDLAQHATDIGHMFSALDAAGESLAADARILDVGGGAGMHAAMLAGRIGRVVCTDFIDQNARFDGKFVALLREKFVRNGYDFAVSSFEFARVDAMDLVYRDDLFDAVVSFNALEHIPDPVRALEEMLRVVRPGGLIYVAFDPVWTCDSGSHFAHRVPEPWAHLLLDDDAYSERILAAGGDAVEVDEYRHAMNRKRLAVHRAAFDALRERADFLVEWEWSGTTHPDHSLHPNFAAVVALGYSEDELLFRGMCKLLRKR